MRRYRRSEQGIQRGEQLFETRKRSLNRFAARFVNLGRTRRSSGMDGRKGVDDEEKPIGNFVVVGPTDTHITAFFAGEEIKFRL